MIISLLTGLAFGVLPAMKLARTNVNSELRDEGRGITGGHQRVQVQNLLVIFQIALCVLLLIGTGLMIRSFKRLQRVNLGFDPDNVLTMDISLPGVKYAKATQQIAFFDELLRKVNGLPGVRNSSISAALPLAPRRITPILPEGQPEVPLAQRPFIIIEAIGTDWFRTMRVPIKLGRVFRDQDTAQAPHVVIVNDALARRFWPNENAIGKHIVVGRQPAVEVVGVAGDIRNSGLAVDSQPQLYLPFAQLPWGNMNLLVRSAIEPYQLLSSVQKQIYSIDPDQPVTAVQTLNELLDVSRSQPRFTMFLLAALSAMALILALVGIYGVLAYMVALRIPELGVRVALGADKADILRLIVGRGLFLTSIGVGVGLIVALSTTQLLASLLYKVDVRDRATFILLPAIFMLVGLAASYIPARRAMRVDPSEALRGN
jgi:putative ABC transport system permease protein